MLPEKLKNEILARLAPLNLEKVILFGSYAWGEPTKDSDIDLYVVTKDEYIPHNFKEKMKIKLKVSEKILDFRMNHSVDLIVHTKQMHLKFIKLNSSFARDIQKTGIRLL